MPCGIMRSFHVKHSMTRLLPVPFELYILLLPPHHSIPLAVTLHQTPSPHYILSILCQPQPPSNIPAYNVALGRGFGVAAVRLERLLQHARVEEAI
jgi:hypothetical protein